MNLTLVAPEPMCSCSVPLVPRGTRCPLKMKHLIRALVGIAAGLYIYDRWRTR